MTIKEARNNAFDNYKKHRLNSWIISIICGLFIAALTLLAIISETLFLIIIPFLALPFLFSCIVSHLSLSQVDQLSWGSLFKGFTLFFRPPFYSSFSVLRSFIKTLIVEVVVGIIVLSINYAIFSQSATFSETMNQISQAFLNNTLSTEFIENALNANDGELARFINLSNSITFLFASFAFILYVLRESFVIYPSLQLSSLPFAHQLCRAMIMNNYKNYHKVFFALNWPYFALLIIGMVIGTFISTLGFNNYINAGVIGLASGLTLSTLYLPFFFSNMESIYDYMNINVKEFTEEFVNKIVGGINMPDMSNINNEVVEGEKKEDNSNEEKK